MNFKIFRILVLVLSVFLSLHHPECPALSDYQELTTSFGKVITGLSKEEALKKYGYPSSMKDDIWYYPKPLDFYVYLLPVSSIHLYPENCEVSIDVPFELKAFAELPGYQLSEVTQDVEFIVSEPKKFIIKKNGIFIPKETGQYQALAKYKNIYSSPAYIEVKKTEKTPDDKLPVRIDVFPYKPVLPMNGSLSPSAFGTFAVSEAGTAIKDLSANVKWFCEGGKCSVDNYRKLITFYEPGKFRVFCKYGDFKSSIQEAEVFKVYNTPRRPALKNIAVLPESISAIRRQNISLRAFGTYDDNGFEEITGSVNWNIEDNDIAESKGKGVFLARSQGITDVSAELDSIESLPVKISVRRESKEQLDTPLDDKKNPPRDQEEKDEPSPEDMMADNIRAFRESIADKNKGVVSQVKIYPERLEVVQGEAGSFKAWVVYGDNSSQDVTLAGDWSSSPGHIARISKGKVFALSQGEAMVGAEYKGIKALPARLFVKEPRLLSIVASSDIQILAMNARARIKADGYYTDNTRRDISTLVEWRFSKTGIIKITDGFVLPRSFGETQVWAEYSGVKSFPIHFSVVVTPGWLLLIISYIIIILLVAAAGWFFVLYLINLKKTDNLISLQKDNAREFIIGLYRNSQDILGLFGVKYNKFMSARFYASLSRRNNVVKDDIYLDFTLKFEKAAYSRHPVGPEDAASALSNYHSFINNVFSGRRRSEVLFLRLFSLVRRIPIVPEIS